MNLTGSKTCGLRKIWREQQLPVEESADINLGVDEKTFDELDRAAAKAQKSLEKRNKELGKSIKQLENAERAQTREEKRLSERGGIFTDKFGEPLPKGLTEKEQAEKRDKKIEKKLKKLEEKIKKDEVRQLGNKETLLDKILGRTTARNILSMGKNPKSFMFGIMKALPILGGILAAKEIAEFIVDEIAKIDRFFKAFIDEVDNRIDAFRTLQQQSDVRAGLVQRIITTASGSTDPRYSYNTFEQFNTNQIELEEKFQMTNNSGVE